METHELLIKYPGRFTLNESQWLSFARRWYEGLYDNHNPFVKEQSMISLMRAVTLLGLQSTWLIKLTGVCQANPHVLRTKFPIYEWYIIKYNHFTICMIQILLGLSPIWVNELRIDYIPPIWSHVASPNCKAK